jgi:hypothetical protein
MKDAPTGIASTDMLAHPNTCDDDGDVYFIKITTTMSQKPIWYKNVDQPNVNIYDEYVSTYICIYKYKWTES